MAKMRSTFTLTPAAATLIVLLAAGGAAAAQQDQDKADEPAAASGYAEPGACATCHEDQATALKSTTHGRTSRSDWEGGKLCESCHGPGAEHVAAGGDMSKIRRPAELTAQEQSGICLSCHEKEQRAYWQGSAHDGRGLSCLTCHKIHHQGAVPKALLAKKTEFETCTSCHLRRKASLVRSAHMPMREGQMTCSSCHNPHGSPGQALLLQNSLNENCYSCHAEKRSPMLWEHAPVKENCANCHDPHGSLHPRMQVMKQPRVCQQCHDELRHPTQPYSDASSTPEFFPNVRMFDRGCMNCHTMIHGSNHPAGMRFLR